MELPIVAAAALVALSLPLLWWSVAGLRLEAARRDAGRQALWAGTDAREQTLARPLRDRAGRPALAALAQLARRLTPAGRIEGLHRRLVLAGEPATWPLERILAAKLVAAGLVGVAGAWLVPSLTSPLWLTLVVAATAGAFWLPDVVLDGRAKDRQRALGDALPDTLDQLSISVEAGLGFEAAMARAGRSGEGPLADELLRTLQEVQVGASRAQALRELADRTEQPDLRHFVLAVVQAEGYGIPIADVLRTQAAEQRVKRRQRAEERAMKIPVKIIFPLVLCILPALFVVVLGPAVVQIVRDLLGPGGGLAG